jgi:2-polyprenyl-3-methyl-5-hydroxy-6-metoxy-1,4-benzoquinol methylase
MKSAVVNERAIEYAFIFNCLKELNPETLLDVGTGVTALPSLLDIHIPNVYAMDNITDYWPNGMTNPHFEVMDDDITDPKFEGPVDVITCISVLEHIVDEEQAVRSMIKLLRPGGKLLLTVPYKHDEHVPDAYQITKTERPYICKMYADEDVQRWKSYGMMFDHAEYWRVWGGVYWGQGHRCKPVMSNSPEIGHQLACIQFTKVVPS